MSLVKGRGKSLVGGGQGEGKGKEEEELSRKMCKNKREIARTLVKE